MILARIVGTVVSTRKDPRLEGCKLLVVKPISPEGADEAGYLIAVDTVDAGFREMCWWFPEARHDSPPSARIVRWMRRSSASWTP